MIPLQGAREDDDRRAAVPLLGLRALGARDQPVLDDRAQAQVRRGGDALADRPAPGDRARRRAGDDPADPRARRRGARPLRPRRRCAPCRSPAPRCRARSPDRWMDHFGENLYNLYGSTEVAWATIATPRDLREAPGTAGRPPRGTIVQALRRRRQAGRRRARPAASSSATSAVRGLHGRRQQGRDRRACCPPATSATSTTPGRLFIDGRDDDMIVSGGENVFPAEVEDLLHGPRRTSPRSAVFGVDDEKFGQRLKAVDRQEGLAELSEDEVKEYVKSNLAGYKVAARRRVHRRAARAPPPARCSSASCARRRPIRAA